MLGFLNRTDLFRSRSLVLTTLSLFLGSFFILMGWLKISPYISSDIHRELRRNFIHFAKLLPSISGTGSGGVKPIVSAKWYRLCWGYTELISGLVMVFLPFRRMKLIANVALLILTVLSIVNHHRAGYRFDRIAPCIVFSLMLACRLIVEFQVHRRDRQKQPTSTGSQPEPPSSSPTETRSSEQRHVAAGRRINHNNNYRRDDDSDEYDYDADDRNQFQDVQQQEHRPKTD